MSFFPDQPNANPIYLFHKRHHTRIVEIVGPKSIIIESYWVNYLGVYLNIIFFALTKDKRPNVDDSLCMEEKDMY